MCENREAPFTPEPQSGRAGWRKATSHMSPTCTWMGSRTASQVPAKRRNKGGRPPADGVEERERTKENTAQSNPFRTQRREDGHSRPDGVRQVGLVVLLPALLPPFIRGRSRVR